MAVGDHIYNCYSPPNVEFIRGEGAYLFTDTGEQYLDFIAGISVMGLGHSNPVLVNALTQQAGQLWHLSNMFRNQGQYTLADKYCEATFADKVFFTNSGAEAVECAIKTARRAQYVEGHPERYDILTSKGAFHGRTIATVNAGGNPKYMEGFGPHLPGFVNLPFGDMDAIKNAITYETAAILVEPVQGEGGVRALPVSFLKELRAVCDEHNLFLIYDEVQCGAGRTGKIFAHQWADGDADPDIMAVAKGMGGGFPMGACLASERAAAGMVVGTHGSTYGGNALATAVGNAVFDELSKPELMDHVVKVSNFLKQQFEGLKDRHPDVVVDVRGKGLLAGMKLKKSALNVRNQIREHKLLVGNAGDNVLRLAPPLIITEDQIRSAVKILDTVFRDVKDWDDVEV